MIFRKTKLTWTWSTYDATNLLRKMSAENKPRPWQSSRQIKLRFKHKSKLVSSSVNKPAVSMSASANKSIKSSSV